VSSITINGNRISSSVFQNAGTAPASNNRAVIIAQNPATTASNGTNNAQQNLIVQTERGNSATIANSGGSTARNTANANGSGQLSAFITQRNTQFQSNSAGTGFVVAAPTADNNPFTENQAVIRLSDLGNSATVTQDGVQNDADININRGGAGVSNGATGTNNVVDAGTGLTFSGGQSAGNSATIFQSGRANRTLVSVGFPGSEGPQGRGNRLNVTQINGDPTLQGHRSTVYQFGQLSTTTIDQRNNTAAAGTPGAGTVQGFSTAIVSQGSFFSTLSLTQRGSNDADLNQGGGRSDIGTPAANGTGGQSGNNTLFVTQNDTGELAASTTPTPTPTPTDNPGGFDPATPTPPAATPTVTAARNFAGVAQAGRNNFGSINQTATRASATLFQRRGSANLTATINQGTNQGFGTTDPDDATAIGGVDGPIEPVAGTGGAAGATNVTATVNQGGLGGRVDVRQDGDNLTTDGQSEQRRVLHCWPYSGQWWHRGNECSGGADQPGR
jgi:hypothetical protein